MLQLLQHSQLSKSGLQEPTQMCLLISLHLFQMRITADLCRPCTASSEGLQDSQPARLDKALILHEGSGVTPLSVLPSRGKSLQEQRVRTSSTSLLPRAHQLHTSLVGASTRPELMLLHLRMQLCREISLSPDGIVLTGHSHDPHGAGIALALTV